MPTKVKAHRHKRAPHKRGAVDLAAVQHKAAFSIDEFCLLHGICRATFVNHQRAGIGPVTMRLHGRVLISREAAENWRRQIEAHPLPKRGRPRSDEAAPSQPAATS